MAFGAESEPTPVAPGDALLAEASQDVAALPAARQQERWVRRRLRRPTTEGPAYSTRLVSRGRRGRRLAGVGALTCGCRGGGSGGGCGGPGLDQAAPR